MENAKKRVQACEFQLLGWPGCREYVAKDATFHSLAASYDGLNTVQDYCEQIAAAFKVTFLGSCELHASAYDPDNNVVFLYGTSCAKHTGEGGPVPSTYKQASVPFVFVMNIDAEAKCKHLEKIYDEASGRRQLGWPQMVTPGF